MSSALFFKYNTQLGPPYQVLVDTNFINFSIKNKVWLGWAACSAGLASGVWACVAQHILPCYDHRHHLRRNIITTQPTPPHNSTTPQSQIDLVKGMLDCLYAECTPCITDCVMAELEKLGQKYRVALKIAKVGWLVCGLVW